MLLLVILFLGLEKLSNQDNCPPPILLHYFVHATSIVLAPFHVAMKIAFLGMIPTFIVVQNYPSIVYALWSVRTFAPF